MRLIRNGGALLAVLFVSACEYGPEHLDALYFQRDTFQQRADEWAAIIGNIEDKNNLEPRDEPRNLRVQPGDSVAVGDGAVAGAAAEGGDADDNEMRQQLGRLQDRLQFLEEKLKVFEDKWFWQLSKKEQVAWMKHRDVIEVEKARTGLDTGIGLGRE